MNITEFAKIAGVSKSAVSRYFNKGYLSEDKRQAIEEAVEKTGYAPSASAQTMRTSVTKLVGVILPKLSSESCARITEGISEILNEEGYQLLLMNTANDADKEVEFLNLFKQNRVDGVILLASIFTSLHKSVLQRMRIPVIIVGQEYKGYNCVCHDDYGAAYSLTELMIKKGAKRVGYIGVTTDDEAAGLARYRGFTRAVKDAGLELDPSLMKVAQFTMESGYEQAKKLLSGDVKPDCIFCSTDNIAVGTLQFAQENNISIPDDIMLSSVGDNKIGRLTSVSLTSAHLHYKTAGKAAAEMLLSNLKRRDSVPRIIKLDYDIIERKSTDRC